MSDPVLLDVDGGVATITLNRPGGPRSPPASPASGLTAAAGLPWSPPRLVGAGQATRLLLLAEPFSSEHALELGLLTELVSPEEVLPTALALARRLASGPTAAY